MKRSVNEALGELAETVNAVIDMVHAQQRTISLQTELIGNQSARLELLEYAAGVRKECPQALRDALDCKEAS